MMAWLIRGSGGGRNQTGLWKREQVIEIPAVPLAVRFDKGEEGDMAWCGIKLTLNRGGLECSEMRHGRLAPSLLV